MGTGSYFFIQRMMPELFINESPIFAPTSLYGCVLFEKLSSNGKDMKEGEASKEIHEPSKSLLEERKDLTLFAEYSVSVTQRNKGNGWLRKHFRQPQMAATFCRTETKIKKVSLD